MIVDDALFPQSSPDGNWIAFFRMAKQTNAAIDGKERAARSRSEIVLFRYFDKKSSILPAQIEDERVGAMMLVWSLDSKFIVIGKSYKKNGSGAETAVSLGYVTNGERKKVGNISFEIDDSIDVSMSASLIKFLRVTSAQRFLLLRIMQFSKSPNNGLLLKSMNLNTGKVTSLGLIKTIRGLDWINSMP